MMRFKNILVPYDGSEHADRALDVAGGVTQKRAYT
mgnify:CR=1 FL=1